MIGRVGGVPARLGVNERLGAIVVIEIGIGGIGAIIGNAELGPELVEAMVGIPPVMARAQMLGDAEAQALTLGGGLPRSDNVTLRAHRDRIPAVVLRIPQVEIVVMHAHRHEIFRAGLGVARHQRVGLPTLRLPERNDVLVALFGRMAVSLEMMVVMRVARDIHPARVPVAARRDGLRAPMRPDSELRVLEPVGRGVGRQRFVRRVEFAFAKRTCRAAWGCCCRGNDPAKRTGAERGERTVQ
ncbi:hypothetical protein ACVWYO_004438 [Sphingomonas sp. UYP23]